MPREVDADERHRHEVDGDDHPVDEDGRTTACGAKDVIDSSHLNAVSAEHRRRIIALLIWAAYFIVPSDAGGLVGGWPLGPIEAAALLAIGWLANLRRAPAVCAAGRGDDDRHDRRGRRDPRHQRLPRALLHDARRHRRARAQRPVSPPRSRASTSSCTSSPAATELPLNFFNDNSRFSYLPGAAARAKPARVLGAVERLVVGAGRRRRDLRRRARGHRRSVRGRREGGRASSLSLRAGIVLMCRCRRRTARRGEFSAGTVRRRRGDAVRFALRSSRSRSATWQMSAAALCFASCERSAIVAALGLVLIVLGVGVVEEDRGASPAGDRSRTSRSGHRDLRRRRGRSTRCDSRGRGRRA